MEIRILIKGGTVVDGSGGPAYAADVRVAGGRIVEIGRDLTAGTGGRTYRYIRDPAPMRLTLVNGEPTFDRGEFTGRYPGRFVGPETREELAIAAE
ncbi:hypothetical protein KRR38_22565 [Novosphingobium sp. G106]|uniref:hypothetical protein n=1 Tax=Novosphingobium sp. G106 TaxID=2849500 RepID=UPI001C2CFE73|nr:hypothetical protein [Novosphingobium sp. G106]MBV1690389.1 hypothetical protein [Novosphingobium sp. G106]